MNSNPNFEFEGFEKWKKGVGEFYSNSTIQYRVTKCHALVTNALMNGVFLNVENDI